MTTCENMKIREVIAIDRGDERRRRIRLRETMRPGLSACPPDRKASSIEVAGTSLCDTARPSTGREEQYRQPGRGTPCGYTDPQRAEK
jgi:hypothetical protein